MAYSSLPDNAITQFCVQAKKNGMDIFRVFDALNDVEQLEVGMKAVKEAGGVLEATVCYSGDSKWPINSNTFPLAIAPNILGVRLGCFTCPLPFCLNDSPESPGVLPE